MMQISKNGGRSWKRIRSEPGPDLVIFKARFDWIVNPRNGKTFKAVVLEARDWVNVVALTPEKRLVVVTQYRFGIREISLEIPAGLVDPGETPLQAAMRELDEETGYTAREWKSLGWSYGNPAFLNNRAHTFLALDVRKTREPRPEDGEDMITGEITLDEVKQAIGGERMRNPMTLLALSRAFDLRVETGGDMEDAAANTG
jgi:8-oxo-dGTP pyrophosphatase MutT (NUDIX family)